MSTAESMTGESKLNFLLSPVVTGNKNNLLSLLPSEFTRQMAQDMRIAQGRKPNPKDMLAQWVFRGYIAYDKARDVYVKTGK